MEPKLEDRLRGAMLLKHMFPEQRELCAVV